MNTVAEQHQDGPELDFHTDMPVGEILRRTRVHYGQSLVQVESVLRIRASQLDAIEKGDIGKLPGRVYAIGFVRSYSEYLGLDGDKMVYLFKEQSVGRRGSKPALHFPVTVSESKAPSLRIIAGSLAGLLVLIMFLSFVMLPKEDKKDIPSVPEELTKSKLNQAPSLVPPPAEALPATATTATTAADTAAATPANQISLEITDSSWIEIRNTEGASILRQVLKPGDVYMVPAEKGLLLSTGNAGGITVKIDGKVVGSLGEAGEIRRKVLLDPETFKAMPLKN